MTSNKEIGASGERQIDLRSTTHWQDLRPVMLTYLQKWRRMLETAELEDIKNLQGRIAAFQTILGMDAIYGKRLQSMDPKEVE